MNDSPDNPLKLPYPADTLQQIHEFARDLAYLFVQRELQPTITLGGRFSWSDNPFIERDGDGPNRIDFRRKWGGDDHPTPDFNLLVTFGYLNASAPRQVQGQTGTLVDYIITPTALRLLEKPVGAPSVFISYRRKDSSAFGLLIEARLRLAGVANVFIDKAITAGEDWNRLIEDTIRDCKYFVCLIGPTTLESTVVRREIDLATTTGCRLISIWHGGATMTADGPDALKKLHAITVTGESAREYETAISQLLNSLGYRTY